MKTSPLTFLDMTIFGPLLKTLDSNQFILITPIAWEIKESFSHVKGNFVAR